MNFINDCNIYLLNINDVRLSAAVRCVCLLDPYDIRPIGLTALIFSARRHFLLCLCSYCIFFCVYSIWLFFSLVFYYSFLYFSALVANKGVNIAQAYVKFFLFIILVVGLS